MRSVSDRQSELKEKLEEYIENGCRLGFLIDPVSKEAWVYGPDKDPAYIDDFTQSLSRGDVLPGFELPLSLFVL